MSKKVAVLAVNPVNGAGLFQYLEAFFENKISYDVYAVADDKHIRTNSGIAITADDVVANLKDKVNEYDALVFSCGDAIPVFAQHANEQYNKDMMQVVKAFSDAGKIMIGHCAAALIFEFAGANEGREVSVHPLAKPAIAIGKANDNKYTVCGNMYTAQDENNIALMIPEVIEALK